MGCVLLCAPVYNNQGRDIEPIISWEDSMLYTIAVVLILLWLLGLTTAYTIGGLIHVLLLIALAIILIRIIRGQRPI